MSEQKPTDSARIKLNQAQLAAHIAQTENTTKRGERYKTEMALSLEKIAAGLEEMAIGLRATYILLEKIERQQRTGR